LHSCRKLRQIVEIRPGKFFDGNRVPPFPDILPQTTRQPFSSGSAPNARFNINIEASVLVKTRCRKRASGQLYCRSP
jgi:hypothetical protein